MYNYDVLVDLTLWDKKLLILKHCSVNMTSIIIKKKKWEIKRE